MAILEVFAAIPGGGIEEYKLGARGASEVGSRRGVRGM